MTPHGALLALSYYFMPVPSLWAIRAFLFHRIFINFGCK
ncbi:hypothetical protein D088_970094 [Salmonella enterica subsp. houtenae serovar 16:z4,z32:-- str. RKS3027]|nr:hypothetical protein D088_970094 [Salmonella enterica subsp. houtenae serovar 16:z4,z32:-- str. RKS3027]